MFQASFDSWLMLLGGTLTIGIIALTVGIIHEKRGRRRSH